MKRSDYQSLYDLGSSSQGGRDTPRPSRSMMREFARQASINRGMQQARMMDSSPRMRPEDDVQTPRRTSRQGRMRSARRREEMVPPALDEISQEDVEASHEEVEAQHVVERPIANQRRRGGTRTLLDHAKDQFAKYVRPVLQRHQHDPASSSSSSSSRRPAEGYRVEQIDNNEIVVNNRRNIRRERQAQAEEAAFQLTNVPTEMARSLLHHQAMKLAQAVDSTGHLLAGTTLTAAHYAVEAGKCVSAKCKEVSTKVKEHSSKHQSRRDPHSPV
ncbi:hypothetical protein CBS101457_006903 [Exobasidium rhododendri]|nr:hypothetical protein CBS101457_006903 [Exobasidium rhododendri]